MRKIAGGFLAILLALVFLVGVVPTINAQAPPAPAIWIEPQTLSFGTASTHVGDKFNVTVWASTATDVFTYQINVTYDPTMLNATSVVFTGSGGSSWWSAHSVRFAVKPSIDRVHGLVVMGETLFSPDFEPGPSSGSIANITFAIIAAPPPGGTLTSFIDTNNPKSAYLLSPDLNKMLGVTFGHATYTFGAPPPPSHQVVVSSLTPSSTNVTQGAIVFLSVVVLNNGTASETFDVNATYDGTLIGKQTVASLGAGNTQTLTFTWNTFSVAAGNYTVTATAAPVANQTNLSSISKTAKVEIQASNNKRKSFDLDGSGVVDMKDIGIAAAAFDTVPGDLRWNRDADVAGLVNGNIGYVPDNVVDLIDIIVIAQHFGMPN